MADLTIVSSLTLPEPDHDEAPLLSALRERGIDVHVAGWDDPTLLAQARAGERWAAAPVAVVRSAWTYPDDRAGFLEWMQVAARSGAVLRNPAAVMAPNTHKSYLAALERAEVDVVPTRWFTKDLAAQAEPDRVAALPWDSIIIKPAIGAGSSGVRAFNIRESDEQLAAAAAHIAQLRLTGEVLVQPRLAAVAEEGERDLVFIAGEPSHLIYKRERLSGDDEHITPAREPQPEEIALARRALAVLIPEQHQRDVMYARVDMAPDELGTLRIIEVELVEPSLFLTQWQPALERFADVLAASCRPH
jgi:hypothetical protein